jgi:hypothetical protein
VPNEVGLHFLQRNSDFCATGLGNQTIPKIPEPGSVLFEVDEDGDLAPFAVRDELNSSHRIIFPYGGSICYYIASSGADRRRP